MLIFCFLLTSESAWVTPTDKALGGPIWMAPGGKVTATIEVLDLLPNGTLPLAPGTGRIFIEVGANSDSTMDREELIEFPDAFLLSFEPLLHHYSALSARKSSPSSLQRLGAHHDRGVVVPFAVSPQEGFADLRIGGSHDGCASLLRANMPRVRWDCANPKLTSDIRRVPTVSLRTVLRQWFAREKGGGWRIDFLKVDAQGFDVEVLRSAGDQISRIKRVQLEVPRDTCERMYEGSMHCSEIVAAMKDVGFTPAYGRQCVPLPCHHGFVQEEDWEFLRAGVRPLYDGIRPWGKSCWSQRLRKGGSAIELQRVRTMCCSCSFIWSAALACFGKKYQMDRCCLDRNISWGSCSFFQYGETRFVQKVQHLLDHIE